MGGRGCLRARWGCTVAFGGWGAGWCGVVFGGCFFGLCCGKCDGKGVCRFRVLGAWERWGHWGWGCLFSICLLSGVQIDSGCCVCWVCGFLFDLIGVNSRGRVGQAGRVQDGNGCLDRSCSQGCGALDPCRMIVFFWAGAIAVVVGGLCLWGMGSAGCTCWHVASL